MILIPPYHTIIPRVREDKISAIGKKMELYQTVFNHPFLCLALIFLKFSNSTSSLVNNCKIFIPVTLSCTKEFKFETSDLTSSKATFINL